MLMTSEGRRGREREGRGEKERVTKDEDEMQMISNGITVLHSLFLHSSTPHLIPPSILLLPQGIMSINQAADFLSQLPGRTFV
jgi:hypothetical protein